MDVRKGLFRAVGLVAVAALVGCVQMPSMTGGDAPAAYSATDERPIVSPLEQRLSHRGVRTERDGNLLLITLTESQGVSPNGVTGDARAALVDVAAHLRHHSGTLRVTGHARQGAQSQATSERLAQTTADTLVMMGVAAGRMQVIGYGGRYSLDTGVRLEFEVVDLP
jgi:type IV pilus biogenesis protein CpaD/CtpE